MDDKKAFTRVTPRDEMVIRRWWTRKAMEGDILFSDGETLSGVWGDVVTPLAVWRGWGEFRMVPTQNPKKRSMQNEIRELMPGSGNPLALDPSMVEDARHFASTASTGTTLRASLIRLASEQPELRPVLLPLLVGDTKLAATDENAARYSYWRKIADRFEADFGYHYAPKKGQKNPEHIQKMYRLLTTPSTWETEDIAVATRHALRVASDLGFSATEMAKLKAIFKSIPTP